MACIATNQIAAGVGGACQWWREQLRWGWGGVAGDTQREERGSCQDSLEYTDHKKLSGDGTDLTGPGDCVKETLKVSGYLSLY